MKIIMNNFVKTDWKEIENIECMTTTPSRTIAWIKEYDNGIAGTINEYTTWHDNPAGMYNPVSHYQLKVEKVIGIITATFQLSTEQREQEKQKIFLKSGEIITAEIKDILNNSVQKSSNIHITFKSNMLKQIEGIDQLDEAKSTCNLMAVVIHSLILDENILDISNGVKSNAQP